MGRRKKKEEPIEPTVEELAMTTPEAPETKLDATLEDMILHVYENAEPGPIPVAKLLGETGLASQYDSTTGTQILSIAWGKLALEGKVPVTQFLKEK